jgi:hypothetical protein
MTTAPDPLDLHSRQLHAHAMANLSPRTLARLRGARRAAGDAGAPRRSTFLTRWLAGGAVAAAVALAVLVVPGDPAVAPAPVGVGDVVAATGEPVVPLQEDPGFYLWLASADATALAME